MRYPCSEEFVFHNHSFILHHNMYPAIDDKARLMPLIVSANAEQNSKLGVPCLELAASCMFKHIKRLLHELSWRVFNQTKGKFMTNNSNLVSSSIASITNGSLILMVSQYPVNSMQIMSCPWRIHGVDCRWIVVSRWIFLDLNTSIIGRRNPKHSNDLRGEEGMSLLASICLSWNWDVSHILMVIGLRKVRELWPDRPHILHLRHQWDLARPLHARSAINRASYFYNDDSRHQ